MSKSSIEPLLTDAQIMRLKPLDLSMWVMRGAVKAEDWPLALQAATAAAYCHMTKQPEPKKRKPT
jgi:hypothetical protein